MIINKHSSFYMRNGWPTKILHAVRKNPHIFSPNNELEAVDELGLGRVMIKALRYWSDVLGLATEDKDQQGILSVETPLFNLLYERDIYFQKKGSLLLLHRNLCTNKDKATAWYWGFNEFSKNSIEKQEFVEGFYSYLISNNASFSLDAVDKEFNCFKNTYVSDGKFSLEKIMEEDTIPFFSPINILRTVDKNKYQKMQMQYRDIPMEILYYCIVNDNKEDLSIGRQISIDKIFEGKNQLCKYFNVTYASLIEMLQLLENKGYIKLFNNFGNRHIEILKMDSDNILFEYFNV